MQGITSLGHMALRVKDIRLGPRAPEGREPDQRSRHFGRAWALSENVSVRLPSTTTLSFPEQEQRLAPSNWTLN